MAFFPGGTRQLLPENATQPKIRPTQVIVHTAVDAPGPTDLVRYFGRLDVKAESHFWVTLSGEVFQMMDTEVRADANYQANGSAISIETEDEGDPVGVPWTAAQVSSLEAIIRWASTTHGIPLVVCTTPTSPGIGYHSMFGAPSAWTPVAGKTCPGPTRIRQFTEVLIPRLRPHTANLQEELDTMTETEARNAAAALYVALLGRDPLESEVAYWAKYGVTNGRLSLLWAFIEAAKAEIGANRNAVKAMEARVATLENAAPVGPVDVAAITEEVAMAITERLKA